jgi:hypothetical protein
LLRRCAKRVQLGGLERAIVNERHLSI